MIERTDSAIGIDAAHEPEDSDSRAALWQSPGLLGLLLFLGVMCAFLPAVRDDFIRYDDNAFITDNPVIQRGWTWMGVKWAFKAVVEANWHPLTCLSHMTDCQIFGLRPWGHHFTSILLHAANATLLFFLLRRMTGALGRSLFVAAFFGLHPLRVESVAWVAERKDVLSAMFWLLTTWAYFSYVEAVKEGKPARKYYVYSLILFVLGLMSKSMLVTLPCALLLLDFWPFGRWGAVPVKRLVMEKIPFLAIAVAMCGLTLQVQKVAEESGASVTSGVGGQLINAVVSYGRYLGKTFWPDPLAIPYPYPKHWSIGAVAAAATVLAAITILAVVNLRRRPYLAVGWCWFLGTMIPVIGLVQVGIQSMADRYTYIPGIGIGIMLAWGAWDLLGERKHGPALLGLGATAVIGASAMITQHQLGYWLTNEILFRHSLAVTTDNAVAAVLVADSLSDDGYSLKNQANYEEAAALYKKAIALVPDYAPARNNHGLLLQDIGDLKGAAQEFRMATSLEPKNSSLHLNLGLALEQQGLTNEAAKEFAAAEKLNPGNEMEQDELGVMYTKQGRLDEAIHRFEQALQLNPKNAEARLNLVLALQKKGETNRAASEYVRAEMVQGRDAREENNLGAMFAAHNQMDEAIIHFENALRIDPKDASAMVNLGLAWQQKGETNRAVAEYRSALKLDTNFALAHEHLADAWYGSGDWSNAAMELREAIRLEPGSAAVHQRMGLVLARMGHEHEAAGELRQALQLKPEDTNIQHDLDKVRGAGKP